MHNALRNAGGDTFVLLLLEQFGNWLFSDRRRTPEEEEREESPGAKMLHWLFTLPIGTMAVAFSVMYFKADCSTKDLAIGTLVPRIQCAPPHHLPLSDFNACDCVWALQPPHE
jgi:hypothetical protein